MKEIVVVMFSAVYTMFVTKSAVKHLLLSSDNGCLKEKLIADTLYGD